MPNEGNGGNDLINNNVPNRYSVSDDDMYKAAYTNFEKIQDALQESADKILELNKSLNEQKQLNEERAKLTKKITVEEAKQFAQQQDSYKQQQKAFDQQREELKNNNTQLRRDLNKANELFSSVPIANDLIKNAQKLANGNNNNTNNANNANNNANNANDGKTLQDITIGIGELQDSISRRFDRDSGTDRQQLINDIRAASSLQKELNEAKARNSSELTEEQKYYNERNKHLIELVSKQNSFFDAEYENDIYLQELRVKNLEEEHDRQVNLIKLQNTGFKDIFKEANKGSANVIETLKKSFDGYHQHMMKKWDEIGGAKGSIAKNVSSALTSVVNTAIDFGTKLLTEGISEIQNSYASTGMNIANAIYADRDEIKAMYGGFADELAEDGWDKATSATKVADQAYTLTTMGITNDDELKTMAQAMTEANLMTGGQLNFNTDEQIKDYHNQYLQLLEKNENDVEKTNEDFKQVIMTQASYWVNTTETYGNAIGLVNGKFTEMADQASQLAQRIHNADPTIDTDGIRNQLMSAYTAVAGAVGDIAPDLVAASQNAISSLTDTGVSGDVLNILGGTTVADELKDTIANRDFGKAYAQILQGAMELQQSGDMTGTEALANNLGINGNELNAIATRYSDENGNFDASAFESAIMSGYEQNIQGTSTSEFQDAKQGRQTDTGFTVEEGLKNMTLNNAAMDIWGAIPTYLADGDKMIITAINTGADLVKGAITSGIDLIIDQFVKGNVVNGVSNLLGGAGNILGSVGYTGVGTLSGAFGGVGAFSPLAIATIAGLIVKGVAEYGISKMDVDGGYDELMSYKEEEINALSALTDQLKASTEALKDKADKLIEESKGPLSDERIEEVLNDEGYTPEQINKLKTSGKAESVARASLESQGTALGTIATDENLTDIVDNYKEHKSDVTSATKEASKHSRDFVNTSFINHEVNLGDEENPNWVSTSSEEYLKATYGDSFNDTTTSSVSDIIDSYKDKSGEISTENYEQLLKDIDSGKYNTTETALLGRWLVDEFNSDGVHNYEPEEKAAMESLSAGASNLRNDFYRLVGYLFTANKNSQIASFSRSALNTVVDTLLDKTDKDGKKIFDESELNTLKEEGEGFLKESQSNFDLYNGHLNEIWDLASDMEKNNWIYENVDGKWERVDKDSVSHDEAWISAKKYLGYTKHSGADYVPTKEKDYVMIDGEPQIIGGIDLPDDDPVSYARNWFSSGHVGGYEIGLNKVPYDNFPALLHKGERVLTAADVSLDDIGNDSIRSVFEKTNNVINNITQANTTNSNTDVTDAIDSQTNSVVKQLNDIIILLGNLVGGMTSTVHSGNPFSVDSITARTGSIAMGQDINAIS